MPKRHPSLVPLSREHHLGLLLAFRILRGLPRTRKPSDSLQEQADDTVRFFQDSLTPHFRAEEEALFPVMRTHLPQAVSLLDTLATQHAEMRRLADHLTQAGSDKAQLSPLLQSFAELLERHIRREERELFPLYEEHIPEAEAARLGADIARLIGEGLP